MHFRNANKEDLPVIVEIYNSTIAGRMVTADTEPVQVHEKEQWFLDHDENTRPLWIIEDEQSEIIGWASFQSFYGRPAYSGTAEVSIYLHQHHRAKGYGKAVLIHCINKAPELKLHTLLGYIFAHNTPSINLFEKLGFEEWANLKDIALMDGNFYSLKILGRKI